MFERPDNPFDEVHRPVFCDVAGCGGSADLVINGVARCCHHHMQEADRARRGAFYSDIGWGSPEQKNAVQAHMEVLRGHMLAGTQYRQASQEQKLQWRKEAIAALRKYLSR